MPKDVLFQKVSGVVASQTVLAHLRKATEGDLSMLNTHPFSVWSSGCLPTMVILKFLLTPSDYPLNMLPSHLQPYVLGDTDSELIFYLI